MATFYPAPTPPQQRICELVEHRAAAGYNQKRDIESDPLTLGKLKKVYFLFANCGGVVFNDPKLK